MWSQGLVFLKYVLNVLNTYIRPHTRALSNSPVGCCDNSVALSTAACVGCGHIWGRSFVSREWVLTSVGALRMLGPPWRALWRESFSRDQTSGRGPHFLAGKGAAPETSVCVCSVVSLCGRMDCSSPDFSVHETLQAKIV